MCVIVCMRIIGFSLDFFRGGVLLFVAMASLELVVFLSLRFLSAGINIVGIFCVCIFFGCFLIMSYLGVKFNQASFMHKIWHLLLDEEE